MPLPREEATVERHRANDERAAAAGVLDDDEIRIAVHEEEAAVEKRPVVKEKILIKMLAVRDTQNVELDLRKERVDVDDSTVRMNGMNQSVEARDRV